MPQDDPWGVTAFTDGLLAGQKFRGLQEELKLQKLQRLDFEHSEKYRTERRDLELSLLTAQRNRAEIDTSISTIERERARTLQDAFVADRPLVVGERQAALRTSLAQAQGAETANTYQAEDRGYTKTRQDQSLAEGEATLGKASTDQITSSLALAESLGRSAGAARRTFTPADALASLAGLDIKGGTAAKKVMAEHLFNQAQAIQSELDQVRTGNEAIAAERKANARRDNLAAVGEGLVTATNLAQLEMRAPGTIDAYAAGEHDPQIVSMAQAIAQGAGPEAKLSPGAVKESEALGKSLGTLQEALVTNRTRLRELEQGAEPGKKYKRLDSGVDYERRSEIKDVERQIKAQESTVEELKQALDAQFTENKKAKSSRSAPKGSTEVASEGSSQGKIPDLSGDTKAVAKLPKGAQFYWYGKLARKD